MGMGRRAPVARNAVRSFRAIAAGTRRGAPELEKRVAGAQIEVAEPAPVIAEIEAPSTELNRSIQLPPPKGRARLIPTRTRDLLSVSLGDETRRQLCPISGFPMRVCPETSGRIAELSEHEAD
jgi:hypothetical protein